MVPNGGCWTCCTHSMSSGGEVVDAAPPGGRGRDVVPPGHHVAAGKGDPATNSRSCVEARRGGGRGAVRAPRRASLGGMMLTLKARVVGGRVVVEDAVDLPDETELRLLVVDEGDDLDDEDRARLHVALEESQRQVDRGEVVSADEVFADFRAGRLI